MRLLISQIHPNPLQPRTKVSVPDLVASMGLVGLVQPIVVAKNADGYVIIAGHRRFAAAQELGWDDIECDVVDMTDPKTDIARIMAENEVRTSLSGHEKAAGFQTMIDLGWSDSDIVAASGASEPEIAAARVLSTAKKKLVSKMPGEASLEEMAALVEFEGTDAYKDLSDSIGTDNFEHRLSYHRNQRTRRAAIEQARVKLAEAEVRVLDKNVMWDGHALRLSDYRIDLAPSKHKDCPGHCAYIDHDGQVVYCCDQPRLHGVSSGKGPKSDEEKALDRRKRQLRALWRASAPVRQEFVTAKLSLKSMDVRLLKWAYTWAVTHGIASFNAHNSEASAYTKPNKNAEFCFVAICVSEVEKAIENWVTYQGAIGGITMIGKTPEDYLSVLGKMGYKLSDHEKAVVAGTEYEPEAKTDG